jgi:hypothetical protein
MSDYLKSTNFATKDSLPSGNAGKIVKGTEIDNEFNAIADAVESKADLLNPTFSGLLTTDTLTTGGATNIGGTLAVAGTVSAAADVQFTGTGRVKVPTGTTAQRPASPSAGSLRFNTTLGFLENYNGTEWRLVSPDPTPAQVSDQANTSTGYFQIPRGNIAQRPVSPVEGLVRYNSETDIYEGYTNGEWHRFLTVNQGVYTINYVVVGGGAGGTGLYPGGGGGAGQVTVSTTTAVPGTTVLTMTIGGGGASDTNGSTSQITGVGQGIGGGRSLTAGYGGLSGNGFTGGSIFIGNGDTSFTAAGGGAGAAANGQSGNGAGSPSGYGGNGGAGLETLITGTSTYLGGGGGGGSQINGQGGAGGTGGGGSGHGGGGGSGGAATVNTGGGGGGTGANNGSLYVGGNGGSGVIYIRMPTINYTGTHTGSPIVTTTGSNTVLKFTGSGTYTC